MLEKIKFYQTGSNTVGNRLLNPSMRTIQASVDRPNALISGHRACQGCGEALGARYAIDAAMRATGGQLMVVNATGCLEVFSTPYPESAWRLPWMHSLFGNAAAVGSGLASAAKIRAQKNGDSVVPRVIAQGGDGGTTDIGMGCLSGMFDRNDDVLYICYDNEAYMNTGVQRSSATPPSARTATTMPVGEHPGADWGKGKDVPLIAMAHGIPYVATATVADLRDLEQKVTKAMSYHGARYIQILVPCPLGWGLKSSGLTVTAARLAMETGFYPIFEAEYGKITSVRKIRAKQPVTNYLKIQKRYAHLLKKNADPNTVARLQAMCDQNIKDFGLLGDDQPELNPTAIQAYERSQAI
ncbi:MAG: thiamine pyrophosphate-dependent enzyme [Aeromonadales bacterium]|jgi:pyruvate ferredoxin oxidoreductase beta subunit|nr:thiamine pyrophosphate-dependent enzyme [Aeromonadales bacterium]MDY2890044.1 thiamine pyrophosphate-dependent enzyme [Succinivibrio sp.]